MTYEQTSFMGLTSVTSSQESEDGRSPSHGPDSPTAPESGRAHAHASRSPAPENGRATPTSATSGPCSQTSYASADLPLFSGSRSQAPTLSERLGEALRNDPLLSGSTEYEGTWRPRATPSGLRFWEHSASARRTSGSGCTGWPTCSARDWKDTPGMNDTGVNPDGTVRKRLDMLARVAQLAAWATPRVTTNGGNGNPDRATDGKARLEDQVFGATPEPSPAATESSDAFRLNPRFSLWLMGYPTSWADAALAALRSSKAQATP